MKRAISILAFGAAVGILAPGSIRADGRGRGSGGHHHRGSVRVEPFWGGWGWGLGWGWGGGYYGPYGPYGPYVYGRYAAQPSALGWTSVKTDVEPDEAALYLDGRLIGIADDFDGFPDRLYLGPGTYTLEFRLEGFQTLTTTVDATSGRAFDVDRHLEKIAGARRHGTYSPAEPEGGVVRFFVKDSDDKAVAWAPGRPPGAAPPTAVRSEPEEPAPLHGAERAPVPEARIVFHVQPQDAAVYIDDRYAGLARELDSVVHGIAVGPGRHRITVTRPGYEEATATVEAADGQAVPVEISLERRSPAAANSSLDGSGDRRYNRVEPMTNFGGRP